MCDFARSMSTSAAPSLKEGISSTYCFTSALSFAFSRRTCPIWLVSLLGLQYSAPSQLTFPCCGWTTSNTSSAIPPVPDKKPSVIRWTMRRKRECSSFTYILVLTFPKLHAVQCISLPKHRIIGRCIPCNNNNIPCHTRIRGKWLQALHWLTVKILPSLLEKL